MSKLSELLKELQKGNQDKNFSRKIKRRFLTLTIFAFLLTALILGGFYIIRIVENLKIVSKAPELPKTSPHPAIESKQPIVTAPIGPESNKSEGNKSMPLEQKETLKQVAIDTKQVQNNNTKDTKTKIKSEKMRKMPISKAPPKVKIDKNITEDKLAKIETISPKEITPLKERGLLENLLLNAEESRKKGDLEEALHFYSEYLKYREDPDVLNNMGSIYMSRGDYKKAEDLFAKALSIKYDPVYELNYSLSLIIQNKKETPCQKLLNKMYPQHLKEQVEFIKKLCK
ncbi:MAG: tetratricopeptide repeat protein [Candidatus Kryptonium sp.]